MNTNTIVENIKCGGCANRIVTKLSNLKDVSEVSVSVDEGKVTFDHTASETVHKVNTQLKSMGYPQLGEGSKLDNAKSYVSCMIGRIQ